MKLLYTIFLVALSIGALAQPKVLFVDDSDDTFGNTDKISQAIQAAGYSLSIFDAEANGTNPELDSLLAADIVVWHTSTDGTALQFWNGNDVDNEYIKAYLDQGGILWTIGNDFLYDRYNVAPATFSTGDFMFDYLGISGYALQSYGDDNNVGLKNVFAATNSPIVGLPTVDFTFSELWWADGFALAPTAEKVFVMGDSNYVFLDTAAAVLYTNSNGGTALTFGYDLSLASSDSLILEVVTPVMTYLETLVQPAVSVKETIKREAFQVYPNPTQNEFILNSTMAGEISIYSITGAQLYKQTIQSELPIKINTTQLGLTPGVYSIQLVGVEGSYSAKKFIIH